MGGTITVVPDGFVASLTRGWVVVGGGTLNSAVADASDATYITDTTPGAGSTRITWTMATSSLPAGSAVKYIYPVIRTSQPAGATALTASIGTYNPPDGISYQSPAGIFVPKLATLDVSCPPAGTVPQSRSQGVVDLLIVSALQYPSSANVDDHRIYKVEGKVVYVDSPTATSPAMYPASANTLTTRPGLQWNYNSADSLTQYEYRVAIWKQADLALFPGGGKATFEANANNPWLSSFVGTDAATKLPVWSSNPGTPKGWVVSTGNTVTPNVDLVNGTAYTYYVQVSALHSAERLYHPTSMGILDFTQSLTTPTVPTSVTPTWQNTPNYRGQIVVAYPTQTLGSWSGRQLIVQGRDSTSTSETDWMTLPIGTAEIAAGSGSATFYDPLASHNQTRHYRAKTLLYATSTGYSSGSAWVTSSAITALYDAFVLRNPLVPGSEVVVKFQDDWNASQGEIQGRFEPLATLYPVIVSDTVKGKQWSVEVLIPNKATELAVDSLRAAQSALVLNTDMPMTMYWVRIGPEMQKRLLRQTDRKTDTKRTQLWSFDLIAVGALAGQPIGAF